MSSRLGLFAFGLALPASAGMAAFTVEGSRITIVGYGTVETPPDTASLTFTIRGEGATSDAAAADLVRKRDAIAGGLLRLLGPEAIVHTGDLAIREVRDRACESDDRPTLSTGACAITGYLASIEGSLRISPVENAGTALGLATRLGASDTSLRDFALRDETQARRRAEAKAIANARASAAGIAAASGVRLGRMVSVQDQRAQPDDVITVTAMRQPPAPPEVAPPPVAIAIAPKAIETSAALVVSYAVEP